MSARISSASWLTVTLQASEAWTSENGCRVNALRWRPVSRPRSKSSTSRAVYSGPIAASTWPRSSSA